MNIICQDYETEAIVGNPVINPPKAVGCAFWVPDHEPFYLAWGHPTNNNTSYGEARKYIYKVADAGLPRLFHNAPFDLAVEQDSMSIQYTWVNQGWKRVHDTLYLVFLADPYAHTFSLKPSADRWLGMAPTEQDELKQWILANVGGATESNWGGYISRAPGDLVGRYAIGDVVRTRKLFELLHARIADQGMEAAYDRERRLMPILTKATKFGIRVDYEKLYQDEAKYSEALDAATDLLCDRIGCTRDDMARDESFANALERCGAVTEWVYTPKSGKRSMSKDNLKIADPEIASMMLYKNSLETCVKMFMRPWLDKASKDWRLHPNWNQVRQAHGNTDKSKGTKTGRLSSNDPNFQNVPTEFTDQFGNPLANPAGLPPLPMLRKYLLPDEGKVWLKRDYSSQELRILAHFEDGALAEAYRGNPSLDPHIMAIDLIKNLTGLVYARPSIKITGFSLIYGSGISGLASQLSQPYGDAARIKSAYLAAMPGVNDLMRDVKRRGERGDSIRTWGGRIYFAENGMVNGEQRSFAYKLLNYLIQGTAADQTKESICVWFDNSSWETDFLATVHDENNIQAPEEDWQKHMTALREAMEQPILDVPVLSEGFVGHNWQDIVKEFEYG